MNAVVHGVLSLFFVVVAYFALRWIGKRFFSGRYRAEGAAAAIVIAFTIGVTMPPSLRGAFSSDRTREPPQGPAPSAPVAAASIAVAASCASAHLTSAVGKGNVDATFVQTGPTIQPAVFHFRLQSEDVIVAQGWAADPELKAPASSVCMAVDGRIIPDGKVQYGVNRSDVATALHNTALAATGYVVSLPAARIQQGRRHIQIAAVANDGSAALLPGGVQLKGPSALP